MIRSACHGPHVTFTRTGLIKLHIMKMYWVERNSLPIFVTQEFTVGDLSFSCPGHFTAMQRAHSNHWTGERARSTTASLDAEGK
jgi:hypothetical protein